ncbi:hypothetical protein ACQEVS_32890 [Streptomyces sp. CA-181903]
MRHRKKKNWPHLRARLYRIYRWVAPPLGAAAVAVLRWWLEVRHTL